MTDFEKMTKEDLDLELQKSDFFYRNRRYQKKITPPTNADLALFERRQSETGFDDEEDED